MTHVSPGIREPVRNKGARSGIKERRQQGRLAWSFCRYWGGRQDSLRLANGSHWVP